MGVLLWVFFSFLVLTLSRQQAGGDTVRFLHPATAVLPLSNRGNLKHCSVFSSGVLDTNSGGCVLFFAFPHLPCRAGRGVMMQCASPPCSYRPTAELPGRHVFVRLTSVSAPVDRCLVSVSSCQSCARTCGQVSCQCVVVSVLCSHLWTGVLSVCRRVSPVLAPVDRCLVSVSLCQSYARTCGQVSCQCVVVSVLCSYLWTGVSPVCHCVSPVLAPVDRCLVSVSSCQSCARSCGQVSRQCVIVSVLCSHLWTGVFCHCQRPMLTPMDRRPCVQRVQHSHLSTGDVSFCTFVLAPVDRCLLRLQPSQTSPVDRCLLRLLQSQTSPVDRCLLRLLQSNFTCGQVSPQVATVKLHLWTGVSSGCSRVKLHLWTGVS